MEEKIINVKAHYDQTNNLTFLCNELNLVFSRIIAALSWAAGSSPAFLVVLGVQNIIHASGYAPLYWLCEYESADSHQLVRRCGELTSRFMATFYGRHTETSIRLLSLWNKTARQQREKEFYLTPAPFTQPDGSFEYHLHLLRDRLKQEAKTVHLSEHSKLPGHLAELPEDYGPIARDTDFPALAALAYAVSASTVFDRVEDDLPKQEPYDMLTHCSGGRK